MREYTATVTSKGQLTLPAPLRRQLGIEPGDQVVFVLDDAESATVRRVEHDVQSVRGLIPTPPGLISEDFDDLIEEAMADHADDLMRRMRESSR